MPLANTEQEANKKHPKPWIMVSWGVILIMTLGIAFLQTLPEKGETEGDNEDPAGLVIMQLQCQYMLGVGELSGDYQEVANQLGMLDVGTVDQRQRYMAFMIAIGNNEAAKKSALHLHQVLKEADQTMTEKQEAIQESIDILADDGELPNKEEFASQLGWFSTLLIADEAKRQEIAKTAAKKVLVIGSGALIVGIFGIFGFVLLLVFVVKSIDRTLRSKMQPPTQSDGVYAETFALWLILFMALQILFVGMMASLDAVKDNTLFGLLLTLVAFFGSLSVLYWPVFRGISWNQVKRDIGWNKGAGVLKELGWGVLGYGMTLPILASGVLITLFLMFLQGVFAQSGGSSGGSNELQGTSGGAHPIIIEIANGGWELRILILLLAAVAAPVVEETMFRGVLYRQLRSSLWGLGSIFGMLLSVLIVSFVFAAIHPQGWVAIPALMGIAIGMNLLREYRASIIASMTIHGVSNGIVTSLMIYFIS